MIDIHSEGRWMHLQIDGKVYIAKVVDSKDGIEPSKAYHLMGMSIIPTPEGPKPTLSPVADLFGCIEPYLFNSFNVSFMAPLSDEKAAEMEARLKDATSTVKAANDTEVAAELERKKRQGKLLQLVT